jgi:hypothetical protein
LTGLGSADEIKVPAPRCDIPFSAFLEAFAPVKLLGIDWRDFRIWRFMLT